MCVQNKKNYLLCLDEKIVIKADALTSKYGKTQVFLGNTARKNRTISILLSMT